MAADNDQSAGVFVLLLTSDDAGLTGFPGTLLHNGRVLVRDLPVERLNGICPGEIVVIPAPGSRLPVKRVRALGTRAQRSNRDDPTVLAVITLAQPVADVPLPQGIATEADLNALANRFDGDLAAGLVNAGMQATLLTTDTVVEPDAPAECTAPEVRVGAIATFSICDWLGIFC